MMLQKRHSERGVAMLMALVTLFLLSILAGELVYQSSVFTSVVFRQRDALRATLLARSGLRLALLQLKAAKKAKGKAKSLGLGDNAAIIDKIWQTPLILPPPDLPGLSGIDASAIGAFRKSLGLEGVVNVNIIGENGRMSINQLVWPLAGGKPAGAEGTAASNNASGGDVMDPNDPLGLKKQQNTASTPGQTKEQKAETMKKNRDSFVEIFNNLLDKKRQEDDSFREKYPTLNGERVVGDIVAWMDPEMKTDGEGRDKGDYYARVEPTPYAIKNAPIATESEFHMIKGLDDAVAKLVQENFTVQTTNSLDVNKASLILLHSLIPDLTADALERIGKRRNDDSLGGPFKNETDFWDYLNTLGSYEDAKKKFQERRIKILDTESSYHVVVVAQSGMATKTWLADIGPLPPKLDADPAAAQPAPQPAPQPQAGATSTSTNTSTSTDSGDTDSLNIVYLRAD